MLKYSHEPCYDDIKHLIKGTPDLYIDLCITLPVYDNLHIQQEKHTHTPSHIHIRYNLTLHNLYVLLHTWLL